MSASSSPDRRRLWWWRLLPLVCAIVLVPWTFYLNATLPRSYTTRNWAATWTGFDVLLACVLGLTALLGILRRAEVALGYAASGTLLLCDAWFDFMTSTAPGDHPAAVLSLFLEIPLAVILLTAGVLSTRSSVSREP